MKFVQAKIFLYYLIDYLSIFGFFEDDHFQPIVNIMKDNMPYQLELNLVDEVSKATVCGFAQAWARTKNS